MVFPVAWQRGPRRAATILAVALSRAVAWRADSAVIAEIVPRLKCFLKQGSRDYINWEIDMLGTGMKLCVSKCDY
jgi:hypothetical protein